MDFKVHVLNNMGIPDDKVLEEIILAEVRANSESRLRFHFELESKAFPFPPTEIPNSERGLFRRYEVTKLSGKTDPNAEYFALRVDNKGKDVKHLVACRIGLHAYADAIEAHLPLLAKDIRERYPLYSQAQIADMEEVRQSDAKRSDLRNTI